MRLATAIQMHKVLTPDKIIPPNSPTGRDLKKYLARDIASIRECPTFIIDEIARYYAASPKGDEELLDDAKLPPLYEEMFLEYVCPPADEWNNITDEEREVAKSGEGCHEGILLRAIDKMHHGEDAGEKILRAMWNGTLAQFFPPMIEELRPAMDAARWVFVGSHFGTSGRRPLCGRPMWSGVQIFVFVAPDGSILRSILGGEVLDIHPEHQEHYWGVMTIVKLATTFMACNNVRQVDVSDQYNPREKVLRRTRTPRLVYKTLAIGPMVTRLNTEGEAGEKGLQYAFHKCRGSFATYGPDAPLFGKYVGKYWRPDHVRGSKERGEVVKNYIVTPPSTST